MEKLFSYVAIPAADFDRAYAFYDAITGGRIRRHPEVPFPMAYFHDGAGRDVGHLFQLPGFAPGKDGPIVYFETGTGLDAALAAVTRAGGTVVMPKTVIAPGKGSWAMFLDTEGNRLALHGTA